MKMRYFKLFLPLFLILICLSACAHKKVSGPAGAKPEPDTIQDIREFPQNLEFYAKLAGLNKPLLDVAEQERLFSNFKNIFFGPWHMGKTSIRRHEAAQLFNRACGYKDASRQWSQDEWSAMRANANLNVFPSRAQAAITTRDTDLRELPTHEYRFSEPTPDVDKNPFDYFQYAVLPVGTPLFIAHTTLDGRWHYVECPIAGGWVDANDVAYVDENFRFLWQNEELAALIRDNVNLPLVNLKAGIGAVLPTPSHDKQFFNVLAPRKGQGGFAIASEIKLGSQDAAIMPMRLTPGNAAKIGNVLLGQKYGWGSMLGRRDCSAMIRDLFTPFGLWLPRNSAAQARRGAVVSLTGLSAAEKNQIILNNGVPFLSLAGMRGHITLYVGAYKGKAAIFHNVWGLRIIKDGNDDKRFVIGRAVVTSITPGMELENLYRPVTFVDRLRSLTRLGAK